MFVEKKFKDSNLPENLLILHIKQNFQNVSGLAQSGLLFKKSLLSSFFTQACSDFAGPVFKLCYSSHKLAYLAAQQFHQMIAPKTANVHLPSQ